MKTERIKLFCFVLLEMSNWNIILGINETLDEDLVTKFNNESISHVTSKSMS